MIKKYLSTIIGLAFALSGCTVNRDISGKYLSKNNPNYIQIKNNHTFIYEYRLFHLYQQSIGKWQRIDKKLLILNSNIKSTIIPLRVKNNTRDTSNVYNRISIDLNITGEHALKDYKCQIYINNTKYCTKRCDSLSSIIVTYPIHSIYFKFIREPKLVLTTAISLPLVTGKYFTKNETGNNLIFKVSFSDKYFYYKTFDNDTLKIYRNGLKMFNAHKGKWEKLLKISDTTNIFSRYKDTSAKLNIFQ